MSTSLPEIYLAFFVQSDGTPENQLYFKNRKLFRNCLSRFAVESTKIDIQFKEPVTLKFNLDEKKVASTIQYHLDELKNESNRKLENLHIFYFGRYWRDLELNLNLEQIDEMATFYEHFDISKVKSNDAMLMFIGTPALALLLGAACWK